VAGEKWAIFWEDIALKDGSAPPHIQGGCRRKLEGLAKTCAHIKGRHRNGCHPKNPGSYSTISIID
jgi:hypothetical protein